MMNTYVMHVTETVESRCTLKSRRKLTYAELEKRALAMQAEGSLEFVGISNVRMFCAEAKPADAIAR